MKRLNIVLLLLLAVWFRNATARNRDHRKLNKGDFPDNFIFGSASSAYQYEGAAHEDGRGPSVWDTFSEKYPEKIQDGSNGSVADDSYHLYKEDVEIIKDIGFDAYRFSISWSRILPHGNVRGGINQAGINYYNNLINHLLSQGITPFITLFHWDTPQGLEDDYGGFRSSKIADDFRDYADICFKEFGDRVKHWMTLNEPLTVIQKGYGDGEMAPGRCSEFLNRNCIGGDSATEPYIVGHNLLLAHAAAVKVYRQKYQASQNGQIGIALNAEWTLPFSESKADRLAAARTMAFTFDWFMEPLVTGSYPADMVSHVKDGRLPKFTDEQSSMLVGSYDFIGINYYTSKYAQDVPCSTVNITYVTDQCTSITRERNGVPIGPKAASDWLYVYPKGIRDLLLYAKYKFKDPIIYVTENGVDEASTNKKTLDDVDRIKYFADHLRMVRNAISVGANVKGYFAWSLLDNFEWAEGYTVRFGLVYVDYRDGLKRYPKKSAMWLQKFLKEKSSANSNANIHIETSNGINGMISMEE